MHPYLSELPERLKAHHNQDDARFMKQYMKNKFEFFGIKTPVRNEIIKNYFKEFGLPDKSELDKIILNLWSLEEREYQYFSFALLDKFKKNQEKEDIALYEKLIVTKSWWDTVDGIAAWYVGNYFIYYPESISVYTDKWYQSTHMWLQRTVLLFQLKYKQNTDEKLLYHYCTKLSSSKEFFIQKAIGWSLREYAKTNPESVKNFVSGHSLASLSRREALKHL